MDWAPDWIGDRQVSLTCVMVKADMRPNKVETTGLMLPTVPAAAAGVPLLALCVEAWVSLDRAEALLQTHTQPQWIQGSAGHQWIWARGPGHGYRTANASNL